MLIPNINIQNFRCFEGVQVELSPLTVLIGKNDSGKSAFLAALRSLFRPGLQGAGYDVQQTDLRWGGGGLRPTVEFRDGVRSRPAAAGNVGFYQLLSAGIPMVSAGVADRGSPPALAENGSGVPTLLDYLLRVDRPRFDEIQTVLKRLIPGFESLRISTPTPDTRSIQMVVEKHYPIDASLASTGVRMLLFFVALAYHPSPPELLLIEEPENGVHPKRLKDIMALLREIAEGKHGGVSRQIVLTTHSPYLLDWVDPMKDCVLVFQRLEDGRRTITAADAQHLQPFLKEFLFGEIWYNEGEVGLLPPAK